MMAVAVIVPISVAMTTSVPLTVMALSGSVPR